MLSEIKKERKMSFPNEKQIKKMRDKLASVEPSYLLSNNADKIQILKYKICEKFVAYLINNNLNQAQLSRKIGIDKARINNIVKYKIDQFTLDKLMEYAILIDPELDIKIV